MPSTQQQATLLHLGALATYHEQAGESLRKVIEGLTNGDAGTGSTTETPKTTAKETKADKKEKAGKAANITVAKLRDKMTEVIRECGREKAVEMIKEFGADKLADLAEAKFDDLAEAADKAIAGAKAAKDKKAAPPDDDL